MSGPPKPLEFKLQWLAAHSVTRLVYAQHGHLLKGCKSSVHGSVRKYEKN